MQCEEDLEGRFRRTSYFYLLRPGEYFQRVDGRGPFVWKESSRRGLGVEGCGPEGMGEFFPG